MKKLVCTVVVVDVLPLPVGVVMTPLLPTLGLRVHAHGYRGLGGGVLLGEKVKMRKCPTVVRMCFVRECFATNMHSDTGACEAALLARFNCMPQLCSV